MIMFNVSHKDLCVPSALECVDESLKLYHYFNIPILEPFQFMRVSSRMEVFLYLILMNIFKWKSYGTGNPFVEEFFLNGYSNSSNNKLCRTSSIY